MRAETWKPVAGYEGFYEVSNQGRVRSLDKLRVGSNGWVNCTFHVRGRILKPYRTGKGEGYQTVELHKNGKGKNKKVHRLVAEAFLPNPDSLPEVNHIDGDKNNNSVNNLEWASGKDNIQHSYNTGLHPSGEQVRNAKLTQVQVNEMRKEYRPHTRGLGAKSLAKKYGVSATTASNILLGKKWRHA